MKEPQHSLNRRAKPSFGDRMKRSNSIRSTNEKKDVHSANESGAKRWFRHRGIVLFLLGLFPTTSQALEPSEMVLLINTNAPYSEKIAVEYAKLRGIPERQLVKLGPPAVHRLRDGSITRKVFQETIWQPLGQTVQKRGLQKQITTIVYSTGFPTTIGTAPPISITGITFAGGENPGMAVLKNGNFRSPFFAGPLQNGAGKRNAATLRATHDHYKGSLPPASMMLGFIGPRGMTYDEVRWSLRRSRSADFTRPRAPIAAIEFKDIRSQCRAWQLPATQTELASGFAPLRIGKTWPGAEDQISGLFAGTPQMPEYRPFAFTPGAAADHLTSLAGHFYSPSQSKCTHWIRLGAATSCGTVTEPFAIWTKFPHARFFTHYQHGFTALEAYMASVSSPFQLLLLGDPLVRPYAKGQPTSINIPPRPLPVKHPFEPDEIAFTKAGEFQFAIDDQTRSTCTLQISSKRLFSDQGFAGLTFNYESPDRYDFFGLHGYFGLWMLGSRNADKWTFHEVWGEPIFMNQPYELALHREGETVTGLVDGRVTCTAKIPAGGGTKTGLMKGGKLAEHSLFRQAARP